jgi:hypothetical protein
MENALLSARIVNTLPHASAIIDGMLCQLTRHGARSVACAPLGSAIVEFQQSPFCIYVREHPFGLLPGLANLYCLDGALCLRWMATWPAEMGYCTAILGETGNELVAQSASGSIVRLDRFDGKLVGVVPAVSVAS